MPSIIFIADLHLSDLRPLARRDANWFKAMARPLKFLNKLRKKYDAPIICAGDVFDRWKASPELISFAIHYLGKLNYWFFAIAGQHDQPQHNPQLLRKSAYTTLMKAGVLRHLEDGVVETYAGTSVAGFSYGAEPNKEIDVDVLVLHRMVWMTKPPYPGAPVEGKVESVLKEFPNVKLIVCGDNHRPFICSGGKDRWLLNCGSVMRMDADQIGYKPAAWVLDIDKNTLKEEPFPIGDDKITREHRDSENERDARIEAFVKRLVNDQFVAGLSFEKNLKQFIETNKISRGVEELIYEAMENL